MKSGTESKAYQNRRLTAYTSNGKVPFRIVSVDRAQPSAIVLSLIGRRTRLAITWREVERSYLRRHWDGTLDQQAIRDACSSSLVGDCVRAILGRIETDLQLEVEDMDDRMPPDWPPLWFVEESHPSLDFMDL